MPKGVGVVFNIVLDFEFTLILTFPIEGEGTSYYPTEGTLG